MNEQQQYQQAIDCLIQHERARHIIVGGLAFYSDNEINQAKHTLKTTQTTIASLPRNIVDQAMVTLAEQSYDC